MKWQDNESLMSMGTDQLLDLFHVSQADTAGGDAADDREAKSGAAAIKEAVRQLGALMDDSQYAAEFDVNTFLASMRS